MGELVRFKINSCRETLFYNAILRYSHNSAGVAERGKHLNFIDLAHYFCSEVCVLVNFSEMGELVCFKINPCRQTLFYNAILMYFHHSAGVAKRGKPKFH